MHNPFSGDPCNDSTYGLLVNRISEKKKSFKQWYAAESDKRKVLDSCKKYLHACIADSLFGYWKSTPWNFYGTTQKPQCGEIACGYFVTTLLRDLGYQIPRVRWAEVASETFIREFCNNKVYHKINVNIDESIAFIRAQKGSYFLVGLDYHVGIIEKRDTSVNLIHSAYFAGANGVTREVASGYNPFALSRYKVFGELFTDVLLIHWMNNRKYN